MKSIKTRLTAVLILIVSVCFIAVACSVYYSLGNVYIRREGKNLSDTAKRITNVADRVMRKTDISNLDYTNVLEMVYADDIQAYSESTGYYIITADKYDRVIFSSSNATKKMNKNGVPSKFIESILGGKVCEGTTDLSDYYKQKVITAAYPVKDSGEIIGAVICSVSTEYLENLRASTMYSILFVTVPVLLLVIVGAYVASRSITGPLTQISRASKLIAQGDLSKRVNIDSKNEIGELARNFNEMTAALESADKMKNSFISDVSHELRTPMTIIIGFLQGILDGTIENSEREKYIGICLEESRRLSRMVSQLLDVARMEANAGIPEFTVFDINEKIRKNVFRFRGTITDKEIKVHADFAGDELYVSADSDNIDRVLTNLIDNAVKFTPKGGKIIISSKPAGEKAEISITNSGNGISDEDINLIWDKFYKTDKSRSMDKNGAGLGLYIVKRIINGHGERITVSCRDCPEEQTRYTTFKFNLKMTKKESA
ncbi:MAG: HAMP domain-containing sensor histidine kinase [Bacillota bacterium]|nr:HAMP domain-containing sensor histidine kinase [Bacillota bacterium]